MQIEEISCARSTVLVVDDDDGFGRVLAAQLKQGGLLPTLVMTAEAALEVVDKTAFDLVLTDLQLPGMDGLNLLRQLKLKVPEVPVVLLTGHGSVQLAVEAMRQGAANFLEKGAHREVVLKVVKDALVLSGALRNAPPPVPIDAVPGAEGILGSSQALQTAREHIRILAQSDSNVLIRGETGTGKELAARAIHALSPRAKKPFVRVNCGAFPHDLFDTEMFGSKKGAYPSALDRPGRVGLAEGGTLFFDEVGDLSIHHQVKLLTFLQDKGYERIGSDGQTLQADIRVVAATNKPLETMVANGTFREDFIHRFGLGLHLPTLREFRDDIVLLANHFVSVLGPANRKPNASLTAAACALLRAHDWPGNVRQLRGFVEGMLLFSPGEVLGEADVQREFARRPGAAPSAVSAPVAESLEARRSAAEMAAVAEALQKTRGNKTQAARVLGISRRSLYDRLDEAKRLEEAPKTEGSPTRRS